MSDAAFPPFKPAVPVVAGQEPKAEKPTETKAPPAAPKPLAAAQVPAAKRKHVATKKPAKKKAERKPTKKKAAVRAPVVRKKRPVKINLDAVAGIVASIKSRDKELFGHILGMLNAHGKGAKRIVAALSKVYG